MATSPQEFRPDQDTRPAMRILFIHNNFPAQYRHIISALRQQGGHQLGFITQAKEGEMAGVAKLVYEPARKAHASTHPYVKQFETAVLDAQGVVRVLQGLKTQGFTPDLICSHTGWASGMFAKDVFPDTPLQLYCEWFTRLGGGDLDFDPDDLPTLDDRLRYRASNAGMLVDLEACDRGLSPTEWQKSRFPDAYHPRIDVLHDGIDTGFFSPVPGARLQLPGLDLSGVEEIVTFVARGMDSYRGFPQFLRMLEILLAKRPRCHAVIVAADRVAYGPPPPEGKSWKEWMLKQVKLDLSRVHFTGNLSYPDYRSVIRASSVHVYLTRPFVLSWSLMEALATGCQIVASDTAPVREVIEDGINGLLTDFFDVRAMAERVESALDDRERAARLRQRARETVLNRYDQRLLIPRHLQLLEDIAARRPR